MHTVQYATTRAELWRWYWKAWARPYGPWRFHMLIAAAIAATATAVDRSAIDAGRVFVVFMMALLGCLLLLPLWPQLRFKPYVRTLTIDARGFSTVIGPIFASRSWAEVRSIEQSGDAIVITGINNNAMIVPLRAFASADERLTFYNTAVQLKAHAKNL